MTLITGTQTGNRKAIADFIKKQNPSAKLNCTIEELVDLFFEEGKAEGIRGDIAIFQAVKETGHFRFGGDVKWNQNNYCGLGATGGVPGLYFESPRMGVRAQIQHLKAYANKEPLNNPVADPRFKYVTRGIAPNWEDLDGRWAVPGVGYGKSIVDNFIKNSVVVEADGSEKRIATLESRVRELSQQLSSIDDFINRKFASYEQAARDFADSVND